MRKFDTKIQYLKYKVLREVARYAFEDNLLAAYDEIPKLIVKDKPTMRCCIYKERAIVQERIKLAMGGDKNNPNVIEVIEIACDECPVSGHIVTEACRGCLAHRCEDVCRRGAITFDEHQRAHIDKSKCVECGQCAKVCPYSAIMNQKRPCERACKIKAISMSSEDHRAAHIDNEKCISCGACVYQCPFGAIVDKSFILDAVDLLKKSRDNEDYKVYAVVAPSVSSQFSYAKLGQVITGIQRLGFFHVIEAALGADMVAYQEAEELAEKGFLTSSCCPAFVSYIKKSFPSLADKYERAAEYIDCTLTFEELQALFDSRDIDLTTLPEGVLDNASYYGRIFARSGGLTDAVTEALQEQGNTDFKLNPIACDGIEACKTALLRASKNVLPNNFIEGMACVGGCIGGAGCLTHGDKNKADVDKYGRQAMEKSIVDAISVTDVGPKATKAQS